MDYDQFYKGSTSLRTYGNLEYGKDTLVRYEFNQKDDEGNKVMDKMTREETMEALNSISKRYGDNVLVEISGDGLAALVEGKQKLEMSEQEKAEFERRNDEFQKAIKPFARRVMIPNYTTNQQLYGSLDGADEEAVRDTVAVVREYLLPWNVGNSSEEERQQKIAQGIEKAKSIAEQYLDGDKKKEYLSAMDMIARFGMNGTKAADGKMNYNIMNGIGENGPDGYLDMRTGKRVFSKEYQDWIEKMKQTILPQ